MTVFIDKLNAAEKANDYTRIAELICEQPTRNHVTLIAVALAFAWRRGNQAPRVIDPSP